MIYRGLDSIDYLAACADKLETAASSHWRTFHADFHFDGLNFEGLKGFGGNNKPYKGFRNLVHSLLQKHFRRMGHRFPDFARIEDIAKTITEQQERAYDLDVIRQALTLACLQKTISTNRSSSIDMACVIGDGFATMATLMLVAGFAKRIVLVNLTKTLLVDLWYLRLYFGEKQFDASARLLTELEDVDALTGEGFSEPNSGCQVLAIQAENHELLKHFPIDIAINIVSMQEMDPPVIGGYFNDLRSVAKKRKLFFYCCNREEKVLPDGTVTRFIDYPWQPNDEILLDELCPWHQRYYSTRPPFYRNYDGPIRHRLVVMGGDI